MELQAKIASSFLHELAINGNDLRLSLNQPDSHSCIYHAAFVKNKYETILVAAPLLQLFSLYFFFVRGWPLHEARLPGRQTREAQKRRVDLKGKRKVFVFPLFFKS
jgi:hypothetical protein